jgi:hypothetical protein
MEQDSRDPRLAIQYAGTSDLRKTSRRPKRLRTPSTDDPQT